LRHLKPDSSPVLVSHLNGDNLPAVSGFAALALKSPPLFHREIPHRVEHAWPDSAVSLKNGYPTPPFICR
jgi:hypothetical protein